MGRVGIPFPALVCRVGSAWRDDDRGFVACNTLRPQRRASSHWPNDRPMQSAPLSLKTLVLEAGPPIRLTV